MGRCYRSSSGRDATGRNTGDEIPPGLLFRFAGARGGRRYRHARTRDDGTTGAKPLPAREYRRARTDLCSWSDHGLHSRGSFEGFTRISSSHKWLDTHGRNKWEAYYSPEALEWQKAFFDHFLKGEDNGFDKRPRIKIGKPANQGGFRGSKREFVADRSRGIYATLSRSAARESGARGAAGAAIAHL